MQAGVSTEGATSTALTAANINAANTHIETAFGLSNLTTTSAVLTINQDGTTNVANSNDYGKVLASLSGMDKDYAGDTAATLTAMANGISGTGSAAAINNEMQGFLLSGATNANVSAVALANVIAPTASTSASAMGVTIDSAEIAAMTPMMAAFFTAAQIQSIATGSITEVSAHAFKAFSATQVGFFGTAQVNNFSVNQMGVFSAQQVGGFTGEQLGSFNTTQLDNFSAAQMGGFNTTAMGSFTDAQLDSFSATQFGGFGAGQMVGFSTGQLSGFDGTQLGLFSTGAMGGFSGPQLASFSTTQLDGFSTTQMGGLNTIAMGSFTGAQLASFDSTQLGGFNLDQMQAFNIAIGAPPVNRLSATIGTDTLTGTGGDDVFVAVGVTAPGQYTGSDANFMNLTAINGRAISEINSGDSFNGGDGYDTLHIYGTTDLTGVTLTSIERVVLHSDVTFSAAQMTAFNTAGVTIVGDSASIMRMTGSGTVDMSAIKLQAIGQFDLAAGLTAQISQLGLNAIGTVAAGTGAVIQAAAGTLNGVLNFAGKTVFGPGSVKDFSGVTVAALDAMPGVAARLNLVVTTAASLVDSKNALLENVNGYILQDKVNLDVASMSLYLGSQTNGDVIMAGSNPAFMRGGGFNDTIIGGSGTNFISGGAGDDNITGGASRDFIKGGEGDDSVRGMGGNDFINTEAGNDTIDGGDGQDFIMLGEGADTVNGGRGADFINLDETTLARDTVIIKLGGSIVGDPDRVGNFDVTGSATNDVLDLQTVAIAANTNDANGTDVGVFATHSISGGIVSFKTTGGAAILVNQTNSADAVGYLRANITGTGETVAFAMDTDGIGGVDSLFVFQNNGTVQLAALPDTLVVLRGVTSVTLGTTAGVNVVQLQDTQAPEPVRIALTSNGISFNFAENAFATNSLTWTLQKNAANAEVLSALTVTGSGSSAMTVSYSGLTLAGTDWAMMTYSGTSTANGFSDAAGNVLVGEGPHAPFAVGGSGANTIDLSAIGGGYDISGNSGNDTLIGSSGYDWISGGTGADTMTGHGGSDEFSFEQGDSPVVTVNLTLGTGNTVLDNADTFTFAGGLADFITDFSSGERINLDALLGEFTGVQGPSWMGATLPTNGLATNQGFFLVQGVYNGTTTFTASSAGADTMVVYDGDSSSAVTQTALVLSGVTLSNLSVSLGSNSIIAILIA